LRPWIVALFFAEALAMFVRRSVAALALLTSWSLAPLNVGAQEPPVATQPLTPAQMAVVNYTYSVFPQQLAAAERYAALAEYEAALWQQRVKSFEPMRSFGVYGATYFADQSAQLEAFAAHQRAECARQQVANQWRERQAMAAALMQQAEQLP
jgi:hypothetical protein